MMTAFWKQAKYYVVALVVFALIALFFLLKGLFTREASDGTKEDILPEVEAALREKVAAVEEEALTARVTAKVEAESQRQELAEVAKIQDGAERRRRLAEMLRRL